MTLFQDIEAKLLADGYIKTDASTETKLQYSRPTKVGAPINKATNLRVDVFITLDVETNVADIAVDSHNGDGWAAVELTQLPLLDFQRNFKSHERRVVYAWRELAD